jgi:hypothetical protein
MTQKLSSKSLIFVFVLRVTGVSPDGSMIHHASHVTEDLRKGENSKQNLMPLLSESVNLLCVFMVTQLKQTDGGEHVGQAHGHRGVYHRADVFCAG